MSAMINGTLVTLRAPGAGDLDFFSAVRNDLDLQEMLMALPKPNSLEKVRSWLQNKNEQQVAVFFVIAESQSGCPVGFIQANEIDLLHGHCWLGICLGREYQRKGYGRDAIALLELYLQRFFRLRKILLRVIDSNSTAESFYLSLGYQVVGTLREHHYLNGKFHDVTIMERVFSTELSSGIHR